MRRPRPRRSPELPGRRQSPDIACRWRSMNSCSVSMPRNCKIVLRTAASSSTAIFRPAVTGMTTFLTAAPARLRSKKERQPLDFFFQRAPAHQVHDQLQAHLAPDRRLAKDRLNIEQAQAAHFQQVLQQRRTAPLDHVGCDAGKLDRIVGHQAVRT